jgi:hypothetical protein
MKVLYIDMDNVLVDFQSGIDRLDEQTKELFADRLDEVPPQNLTFVKLWDWTIFQSCLQFRQ